MKLLTLTMCSLLALSSCTQKGFVVEGDIKGGGNRSLIFTSVTPTDGWQSDTIIMKDGKFSYQGEIAYPTYTSVMIPESETVGDRFFSFHIYMENSKIKIKGDVESPRNVTVTGSAAHDEYNKINELLSPHFKALREATAESSTAFKANDKEKTKECDARKKQILTQIKDQLLLLPNYSTSLIIPKMVNDYFSASSTFNMMGELIEGFDVTTHTNPQVKYLIDDFEREKTVQDGAQAFDFELKDIEGNTHRLADLRGKYVLLEFSASWCGWCKLEVPFLKEVYEITKEVDDFVMYTVNLDTKRELWAEEAGNDIPWKTIGDLNGVKDGVALKYNIHGVPMIYLISPEGKIMTRSLRREAMVEYFKEMYK